LPFEAIMNSLTTRLHDERGISLIEMMVAVAIIGALTSMAVIQIGAVRPGMQADGAMRVVMSQLNAARETAISQRRRVEVSFNNGHWVRVTRHNLDNSTTVLTDVPFEGGVRFGLAPNVQDTPDGFGNVAAISFGAAVTVMFNTEGMLVDNAGIPVNGTVFLLIPTGAGAGGNTYQPGSFRAVTVLGSTGRVRGFRWNGGQWTRV
jgi:prepilin-type N-terminal cleavage/methylation domain-containing protein